MDASVTKLKLLHIFVIPYHFSTDMRENTVISGHQEIRTLYAPNNVVYPDSISVNLINAPGNSTVQCDCGHINCPLCNLLMNLELSEQFYK